MTGALLLASDPAVPLQASTKQYVDLHVMRNGDTLTGALFLASNPTAPLQAATKQYIDNQFSTALTTAGGTFTGRLFWRATRPSQPKPQRSNMLTPRCHGLAIPLPEALLLASDPVASTQAATKNYVDTQVLTALPLSGGSLTGISHAQSRTQPIASQAATKHYVDAQVATALPVAGGSSDRVALFGRGTDLCTACGHEAIRRWPGGDGTSSLGRHADRHAHPSGCANGTIAGRHEVVRRCESQFCTVSST